MNLNLRRLKCFMAVAEHGHFGRAANALCISKTALSEQIRILEQEWELRLFDRHPRGAKLTPDGATLLEAARSLLVHEQGLLSEVAALRRSESTVFRLGFGALAAGVGTTRLIEIIQAARPDLEIRLTHLSYARQLPAVLESEVDASIVRGPVEAVPGLRVTRIAKEPRMAMLSSRHPLASRSQVSVADLRNECRVTTDGVPEHWRRWWSLDPGPGGAAPPYGLLIHSWEEQLEAAASQLAISIVPATAARVYQRSDLAFIPITDAEPCDILVCTRQSDSLSWLADAAAGARAACHTLWSVMS